MQAHASACKHMLKNAIKMQAHAIKMQALAKKCKNEYIHTPRPLNASWKKTKEIIMNFTVLNKRIIIEDAESDESIAIKNEFSENEIREIRGLESLESEIGFKSEYSCKEEIREALNESLENGIQKFFSVYANTIKELDLADGYNKNSLRNVFLGFIVAIDKALLEKERIRKSNSE